MYLNNSTPESTPNLQPNLQNLTPNLQNLKPSAQPDYAQLVRFLISPFLESPESLKVDCEHSAAQHKTWIRLAFESEDKGRVYGRGGRNIQAIRTVLSAIAQSAGESVYLDIYESPSQSSDDRPRMTPSRPTPRRSSRTRRRSSAPRGLAKRNRQSI